MNMTRMLFLQKKWKMSQMKNNRKYEPMTNSEMTKKRTNENGTKSSQQLSIHWNLFYCVNLIW